MEVWEHAYKRNSWTDLEEGCLIRRGIDRTRTRSSNIEVGWERCPWEGQILVFRQGFQTFDEEYLTNETRYLEVEALDRNGNVSRLFSEIGGARALVQVSLATMGVWLIVL